MRPMTRDASPAVSGRESRALKCQIPWFTPQTCLPRARHRPRCSEIRLRIWRMEWVARVCVCGVGGGQDPEKGKG